jgi:predicted deacetylase
VRAKAIVGILTLLVVWAAWPSLTTTYHSHREGLKVLRPEGKMVWIEVHDVSPGYDEELREVIEVLERHRNAFDRAVLFVIPNHGGRDPISLHPEFVNYLMRLESMGYELGLHGYSHTNPLTKPEFDTSLKEAERLLNLAKSEFEKAGLDFPEVFLPPGWRTSSEVAKLLRKRFEMVYYFYYLETKDGIVPSKSHEYVWHGIRAGGVRLARLDYLRSEGIYRLTLHLGAINDPRGLEFLDEFLEWIEARRSRP